MTEWEALAAGVELVATDLDGTLLRRDGSVSPFTVETFGRARDLGFPLVFVTGRPPRWMKVVVEATGHAGVAICANGAVLVDLSTEEILETRPIPAEALATVVTTLRQEVPGVAFAVELVGQADTMFAHEHAFLTRYPVQGATTADDVLTVCAGREAVKLLVRLGAGGHDADSFLDAAADHVAEIVTVTHSNSADVLLEISAAGVSKGRTLAHHAAAHGVSADGAAAIGDMPNDLPMIRWARVGLAVAEAHPNVLAEADAVLPGPDDDGVARFVDLVLRTRGRTPA